MIKTYVYTGTDETRVLLKAGQSKVTVQPNGTVQSELPLDKSTHFTLVGADSVDSIVSKISDLKSDKKSLSSLEKQDKDEATARCEEEIKVIKAKYKELAKRLDGEIDFLEVQKKAAYNGIDSKIKELEAQKKALDAEKKLFEGMQKEVKKQEVSKK